MNATAEFDVFVSYNTLDHAAVERLGRVLKERGLKVFLDRWELVAGRPWPEALEDHLARCRAAAIVLGPHGLGPWQQRERNLALDRQGREPAFGVIPVLLPNADLALGFLRLNTWVDLSAGVDDPDALDLLAAAIRGEAPASLLKATRKAVAQVCPYRGLEVFREEDAPFFFGREAFTEELCKAVASQSLVAVVGRSGSGKSSVVRAGLVPALRQPDADKVWEIATLLPGSGPLHALAGALLPFLEPQMTEVDRLKEVHKLAEGLRAGELTLGPVIERVLAKQPGTDRLLLMVDQWEEVYTQAKGDDGKARTTRFIDVLLAAVDTAPVTVVLTLRADFYGDALGHRGLADLIPKAQVALGPMTREELKEAVVKPAEKVHLTFEDGLPERLLDDVGDEPGNLPLMEFALKALWESRRGDRLVHSVYQAMGGIKGAVAQRAEAVYSKLDLAEQRAAERLFTKLVRPGDETGDTRRRAGLDELDATESALVRELAGKDARLLVTGRDPLAERETVEVAHEALIREWGRLRGWIDGRRTALLTVRQLQADTLTWLDHDRERSFQWSHERVREAAQALSRLGNDIVLGNDERAFLGPVDVGAMLAELDDPETTHKRRALIGERLDVLGDPRPGVGVSEDGIPDIAWCPVAGGDTAIAVDRRLFGGTKTLRRRLLDFHIARYPITVAQYRAFLDAEDGLSNHHWWRDDLYRDAEGDSYDFGRFGNHPAVYVSWFDAMAFCRWLSERLQREIRLPDEWEWQRAATAGDLDNVYPWGPDWEPKQEPHRANTFESRLGAATAVGMYPAGIAPTGAFDMAGTVYEWCLNKLDRPEQTVARPDDFERRVLRGGAWSHDQDDARSAFRNRLSPYYRNDDVGFRVLCSSPICGH